MAELAKARLFRLGGEKEPKVKGPSCAMGRGTGALAGGSQQ